MPLTQEKCLDSKFSNNNDSSYLHKKFKKMASTISVLPACSVKSEECRPKETTLVQIASTSISNGSIAAAHPEIEKIKEKYDKHNVDSEKNVQINFNDENYRLSDVSNIVQVSGKTSFPDEFLNKTENLENDFIKETYSGGSGRYICPYCKLSCAKPSVLQKHIRAHTNERPFPCIPCGFAFKTKSNLYKHRRSRTHALRAHGADVIATINDDDLSGGSESDTSTPPIPFTDSGMEATMNRVEYHRPDEYSSPEFMHDSNSISTSTISMSNDNWKIKSIYKPKFRAALYQGVEEKDKIKKTISHTADFLTEHISKIISDNEAIVDVIETPLQKKYGKIKQIAESKQLLNEIEIKPEITPLNLTKNNYELEHTMRKRSHSETSPLSLEDQKHPLNPEGSIIKDLLLKNKANGLITSSELVDGLGAIFVCPLCQIIYRSAENLEIHRMYYCKGNITNNSMLGNNQKEGKISRPENVFLRSHSINVRMPESPVLKNINTNAHPLKNKPDNLVILKSECNDVIAPLPSPGPLLGNTRLVDTRTPLEFMRKTDILKARCKESSPKRRLDNRSDSFSPRLLDTPSPRSADLYPQSKIRCIETSMPFRTLEDMSQHMRHTSTTSLQMFGGEVKIVDHSGSTTTLRIEPSKNQLSPILIHQNISPSKLVNDCEASSVVVRSGLHSGGIIVHNPPTPKEIIHTPLNHTPRSTPNTANPTLLNIHDITHFQFPPLSAITAYNPLTLPPLSPSSSPSGTSTILHGGKLIPHVPGIPGPNTPTLFITQSKPEQINLSKVISDSNPEIHRSGKICIESDYEKKSKSKSPNIRLSVSDQEKNNLSKDINLVEGQKFSNVPIIKIRNVDEPVLNKLHTSSVVRPTVVRPEGALKRNADGFLRSPTIKDNVNYVLSKYKNKEQNLNSQKNIDLKSEQDINAYNFENLITKAEIYNNQIQSSSEVQKNSNDKDSTVSAQNERSETSYFQKNLTSKSMNDDRKPKFLRPSTLPLKPGTFTPKRHHGITPNANTMPLVSPETPRPAKAYGQLYLNGNAYTYLGLKCSTKVFYCTINRPQPTYVPDQHFLSMYSNWQLLSELTPDPLGLSASTSMSLYDSRHRPQNTTVALLKQDLILTHSSQWNKYLKDNNETSQSYDSKKTDDCKNSSDVNTPKKELTGGFESNEEYTYVRGRGRGRYVCSECGIRCKKPSMLKKHIRTHTDVRPYTCIHCVFSFKTKGNLTKHMKSKSHYKKCCELGINPNEGNDMEGIETSQCSGETDDETDSDGDEGNEGETESSDTEICKSRLPEHEAAHGLLSLYSSRPATTATPGLITSARPTTYPYSPIVTDSVIELIPENPQVLRTSVIDMRMDIDNEPMDLSKSDIKISRSVAEIPTARESSVLASLASNTAKLPHHQSQWVNGEPMLHTYLTERALLDSKIKQSQLTSNLCKVKKIELENSMFAEKQRNDNCKKSAINSNLVVNSIKVINSIDNIVSIKSLRTEDVKSSENLQISSNESVGARTPNNSNPENAKYVVSEYLKQARINHMKTHEDSLANHQDISSDDSNCGKTSLEDKPKTDEMSSEDSIKLIQQEYDPIASKVVIGVGGVAFKVTKGKEFENTSAYSPGKLMEDGRKVCDFCNKTFTKPSQLKLHLNIHYMERPFRCSVCAVSFRTRGHLQKHERSGSHHNKVSMTSTFGAATSFNPRPFRCSDCNIAFRIHGHLAKHLRSKMHVMRLECLFKLPFGTFTEIERAGLSLTDIDTTDCASSLASLQSLARKLHEKDPTKLEYREPSGSMTAIPSGRESSEDEDHVASVLVSETISDSVKDSDMKTISNGDHQETDKRVIFSATDN